MLPQMEITHSKKNQSHKIDSEVPGAWAQGGVRNFKTLPFFLGKAYVTLGANSEVQTRKILIFQSWFHRKLTFRSAI